MWQKFLETTKEVADQERNARWGLALLVYRAHQIGNDNLYDATITTAGLAHDTARKYWQVVEAFQENPWERWPDLTWTCFLETRFLDPENRIRILDEAAILMGGRTAFIKEQKALLKPSRPKPPRDIFEAADNFEKQKADIETRWPAEHRDQLVRRVQGWADDLR